MQKHLKQRQSKYTEMIKDWKTREVYQCRLFHKRMRWKGQKDKVKGKKQRVVYIDESKG